MRVIVELAGKPDIPWILNELEQFAALMPVDVEWPGEDYPTVLLEHLISDGLLLIARRGDQNLGFIGGIESPHICNPGTMVMNEIFWWVPEEFRGGRAGFMLLKEYIARAKLRKNVKLVTVSLEESSKVSENTLERIGLKRAERTFFMET